MYIVWPLRWGGVVQRFFAGHVQRVLFDGFWLEILNKAASIKELKFDSVLSSRLILFGAMCGCSPHLPYKPFLSDMWYCDSVKISCSALFSLCGAGLQQLKSTSAGWWVFPFCWWLSSSISFLVLLKDKSSFITTNIFWLIFNAIMFCQKLIYLLN